MIELLTIVAVNIIALVSLCLFLYWIVQRKFNESISTLGSVFGDIFEKPSVKRAMGILGKHSGESRAMDAVVEDAATQVLSSDKMQGIKLAARAIGIDLDGMIEDHGAVSTLQGLNQLAGMLGIDLTNISLSGLSQLGGNSGATQPNPYFRG